MTVQAIVAANNITNPNKIRAGQKLILPGKVDTGKAPVAPSYMLALATAQAVIALQGHALVALGWTVGVIAFVLGTWLSSDNVFKRIEIGLVVSSTAALVAFALSLRHRLRVGAVPDQARPQPGLPLVLVLVLGAVAHEIPLVAHTVHHVVTDIHAGRTIDALVLKAIADVDTRRARHYAKPAVDARAKALRDWIDPLGASPARLALDRSYRCSSNS